MNLEEIKTRTWDQLTAGEKAHVRRLVNLGKFEYDIPAKKKKE